jgi:hypothetical protein
VAEVVGGNLANGVCGADLVEAVSREYPNTSAGTMAANLRSTRTGCSCSMAKLPRRHHPGCRLPTSLGLGAALVNKWNQWSSNTTVVEFSQTRFQNPTLRGAADPSRHFAGA